MSEIWWWIKPLFYTGFVFLIPAAIISWFSEGAEGIGFYIKNACILILLSPFLVSIGAFLINLIINFLIFIWA